ncbi:hypothetical protein QVD17_14101 [Tagetes erecta]|uniref:Uncharacterized protein n=1 Tax=Tagetes erecta TaxID=13708 RepID=A0AAD8KWN5_TARER|nr:hypothetical protein QVD17_14101 [Tagetes erecta]
MPMKPSTANIIPLVPSKNMTLKPAAADAPIKIGTKGTVGSLMMKEIEYFNRLEVQSQKSVLQVPQAVAGDKPKPEIDSVIITPKRKKRTNKFMPSICSVIDVADHNGPKLVSGLGYRTLKADVRRLQV